MAVMQAVFEESNCVLKRCWIFMEENNMREIGSNEDTQIENIEISELAIKNLIYVVRDKQVMLDSDLAMLYQVETKVFNQAVKRNIERFPETFRFQLTKEEEGALRSQIVTSKGKGGRRYRPYVFTEQGIAMLSAVLRSDIAVQVSIKIMETFGEMRRFLTKNSLILDRINDIEVRQLEYQKNSDEKFDKIFQYISEHEEVHQKIFFEGQIYDAFSLLVSLMTKAEKKLVLIDNYVDIDTLNIISKKKKGINAVIYTMKRAKLSEKDINNFNQQYPTLTVHYTKEFHDRFLLIDETYAYHIGTSIKDAGKKCFAINKIEDRRIVKDILQRLEKEAGGECYGKS